MARLLASWSGFRFRVLHKAASGPCVAVDDDDCDDERLNCQQAIALSLSYSTSSTVMTRAPGRGKIQDNFETRHILHADKH